MLTDFQVRSWVFFVKNIKCFLAKRKPFSKFRFVAKDIKSEKIVAHNRSPKILRFFDILPIFPFFTWGMKYDKNGNTNVIYKFSQKLLKDLRS